MRIFAIFLFFLVSVNSFSQLSLTDPILEHNRINSFYFSGGLNWVQYSNYNGIYDSLEYSINNHSPSSNFGIGYVNSLYFMNENSKNKLVFSFGGELSTRKYKMTYATEEIKINETYIIPLLGIGGRSEVNHSLWLIDSYKAIEYKLMLGSPILLSQNAILDHSKIKSTNSIYFKYHIGFDIKFSSLQSNGKGHQIGTELFIENSKQDIPNSILFRTPYYVGFRIYYCFLNIPK